MTPAERVADWITAGALTRARSERDAARRSVRTLSACVGADIPVTDHQRALQILGAVLARFRDGGPGVTTVGDGQRVQIAKAGPAVVGQWRAEHNRLDAAITADRRDLHTTQQRHADTTRRSAPTPDLARTA